MALSIERLRYYDGESLRAYDFSAEQAYLVDMRRRLHLALGIWGIVDGLDISSDTQGSVTIFAINPGVAIDPAGREIFLFMPYQLDDTLLNDNLITTPNSYQILLQYKLTPNTPPSAGYGQCNGGNQYTRWQEGFQVLIRPKNWTQPTPLPVATDAMSENASQDGFAVPICVAVIGPDASGSLAVQSTSDSNRRYVGTRTQRIVLPVRAASLDITAAETPLEPPTSLEVQGSVYVDDNLIVGKNFAIGGKNPPKPAATGDVKVAGDIILQGKIYTEDINQNWTDLVSSVQSQVVPQVVLSTTPVEIDFGPDLTTPTNASGSLTPPFLVPTTFPSGSFNVSANCWVSGVATRDSSAYNWAISKSSGQVTYDVSVTASPSGQNAQLTFQWSTGPVVNPGVGNVAGQFTSALGSISVGYMVVFTPKTS